MIQGITIDQTLIELARTMKALKALRAARKDTKQTLARVRSKPWAQYHVDRECVREHAAAIRASLDLTRKLADLRQGR